MFKFTLFLFPFSYLVEGVTQLQQRASKPTQSGPSTPLPGQENEAFSGTKAMNKESDQGVEGEDMGGVGGVREREEESRIESESLDSIHISEADTEVFEPQSESR